QSRLEKFGPDDKQVKNLQILRRLIRYDYWLARCKLEQTAEIQHVRRLTREASAHALRSRPREALKSYRRALHLLGEAQEQQPAEVDLIAESFWNLARGYRTAVELLPDDEDDRSMEIVSLIEESMHRHTT